MATTSPDSDESQAVAAQRAEFLRATDMETDLDFAYRLQMEEAIAASLSLKPPSPPSTSHHFPPWSSASASSSSSSSHHFPPRSSASASSFSSSAHFDGVGALNAADLQVKELDRFQRERKDKELSEVVARSMLVDLSLRIHDHNFARDIVTMPEDDWDEYGDDYEKPFVLGEGSSSSASASSEVYGLYSHGSVSEERVNGSKVSAIGIAICDPSDTPILEVSKPFKEVMTSRQVAEFKALIEALETAFSLGLERITFYCHYYPLYQYVTQRWKPKQAKIAELTQKIALLQRKFQYCRPLLVARYDIKYAFKLARDAIVSQINLTGASKYDNEVPENCVICLEETNAAQVFTIPGCFHRYCISCMRQHMEVKLRQGIVPKCPHSGCNSELTVTSCEKFLTSKFIDMMKLRIKEASIPVTEKVYCPFPKCSFLMSKSDCSEFARKECVDVRMYGGRRCMNCYELFCMNCKVPWHHELTCSEYKRMKPVRPEDATFKTLATKNLWRQCVKCKYMIEWIEGCYHMTCRCGHEFCYTCGAEWVKAAGSEKKPTCSCPLFDEPSSEEDNFDDDDEYGDYSDYYSSDEDIY